MQAESKFVPIPNNGQLIPTRPSQMVITKENIWNMKCGHLILFNAADSRSRASLNANANGVLMLRNVPVAILGPSISSANCNRKLLVYDEVN